MASGEKESQRNKVFFFIVEKKECFALSLPKNVPRMKMDSLSQFEGNVF